MPSLWLQVVWGCRRVKFSPGCVVLVQKHALWSVVVSDVVPDHAGKYQPNKEAVWVGISCRDFLFEIDRLWGEEHL